MLKNSRYCYFLLSSAYTTLPFSLRSVFISCCAISITAISTPVFSDITLDDFSVREPNNQVITPYADYTFVYNSNMLRLNRERALSTIGVSELSDTSNRVNAGVNINKEVGQQQITAEVSANQLWFNRFDFMNTTGYNGQLNWNWHVGNHFHGNIGTQYTHELAPFLDYYSTEKNIRNVKRLYVDGVWQFHPSWQTGASYKHNDYSYDSTLQSISSTNEDIVEASVDYLPSTNSTVGLVVRHTNGDLPVPTLYTDISGNYCASGNVSATAQGCSVYVNNSYKQNELKAKVDWRFSEKTRLVVLGGFTNRQHSDFSVRDFSGFNIRATGSWMTSAKTGVTFESWHEIGAYQDLTSSYTLNTGASLLPVWAITAKTGLEGFMRFERRDYQGESIFAALPLTRADLSKYASIALVYNPIKPVKLSLLGFTDRRTSNFAGYAYQSNGVMLNARFKF